MNSRDRLTLAATVAVALATSALSPLYADLSWLPRALGSVLVVALVGLVARRGGVPAAVVPLVQLVGLGAYTCLAFARQTLWRGVLPTGRTLDVFDALVTTGRKDIMELAAPVPATPGLLLFAVLGIGAVALAVDLLAVGMHRAAVAGLPLLVLFAIPSGVLPGGLGWLPFALGAAGWLTLLLVESEEKVGRWGLPLRTQGQAEMEDSSLGRVGRRIGVAALSVSLVLPALVPGLDGTLFPGSGAGGGNGDGNGRTTITYNPITRLQGELQQPRPTELLRYTTTDTEPDYLRMTTLDTFDGSSWRSSSLTGERVSKGIPAPVGVEAAVPVRDLTTIIDMTTNLDTRWLPVPANPTAVDVKGRWLWDPTSDTAFSTRSTTRRVGRYEVNATRVLPSPDLLRQAGAVAEAVAEYAKPVPVDASVVSLTEQVTASAPTAYEKARALQAFFRDRSNGFEYDVTTAPRFDNPDALTAFLDRETGRRGFCEQYASAMAVMLRILGIPSRVAVGFTPGTVQPDLSRLVTTADAHAWPEAWFAGTGWIRFEPTPAGSRAVVPDYSTVAADAPTGPIDPNTGAPTIPAGGDFGNEAAGPSGKLDRIDPALPVAPLAGPQTPDDGLPSPWLLVPIVLLLAAVTPGAVALGRRRARWSSPGPLTGWQQVQDDARDVGHRWRPADSPRAAAAHLALHQGIVGAPAQALHRLAVAAERERYARPGSAADLAALHADATAVRKALLAGVPAGTRLRARLAPPATLGWLAHTSGTLVADALDRVDDAVASVSRRLHRHPA